jgi:hypothetical protein
MRGKFRTIGIVFFKYLNLDLAPLLVGAGFITVLLVLSTSFVTKPAPTKILVWCKMRVKDYGLIILFSDASIDDRIGAFIDLTKDLVAAKGIRKQ